MLQLNFLRNHFLTVRALQRWSRLCKGVISSFGGREWQWYSCRNWITICQGCYSNENTVYIIEYHKGFIFILSAISVEQNFCWHKIIKLKWRILNHSRSDSTKCVKSGSQMQVHENICGAYYKIDFRVPLHLISLVYSMLFS